MPAHSNPQFYNVLGFLWDSFLQVIFFFMPVCTGNTSVHKFWIAMNFHSTSPPFPYTHTHTHTHKTSRIIVTGASYRCLWCYLGSWPYWFSARGICCRESFMGPGESCPQIGTGSGWIWCRSCFQSRWWYRHQWQGECLPVASWEVVTYRNVPLKGGSCKHCKK